MLLNGHPDWYDAVVLSGTVLRQLGSGNLGDLNKRWAGPDATGMEWLSRDPTVVQGVPRRSAHHEGADGQELRPASPSCG